jgi:hypothetical protein
MTTPSGVAPRTVLSGQVVTGGAVNPTAIIDPMSEAVHGVVTMLKALVKNSGAFHSEKDLDEAHAVLSKWEKAQVKSSTLDAILNEYPETPAEKEDVTKRVAPNSNLPQALSPQFDYRKLAQAILAIQAEQQAADAEVQPA